MGQAFFFFFFLTYAVWINKCVFLLSQAYSATRHRDTTCAAMTNIKSLRLKESKATKICFCPRAKACTALWATSDFSTSQCNATSHALALALQLEQALRILSPELIIHSHTRLDTHMQACLLQQVGEDLYLSRFPVSLWRKQTNTQTILSHPGNVVWFCPDNWHLSLISTSTGQTHTNTHTSAAGTSLHTT